MKGLITEPFVLYGLQAGAYVQQSPAAKPQRILQIDYTRSAVDGCEVAMTLHLSPLELKLPEERA